MRLRHGVWLLPLLVLSCVFLMTAAIPKVPTGTWQTWNPMGDARSGAASVLLQDGRVLFIGGNNATGAVASADLFGTDGIFSAAALMHTPRSEHTATVLSDGRVLVTGGTTSGGGITNSAEIYDPGANLWTLLSGTMVDARSGHTASLLPDGRVLLAGGQNSGGALNSLEIFDPSSGSFSGAGVMTSARMNHAATSLQDGRVLIVGGWDGTTVGSQGSPNVLATSDIFDPSSGLVSPGPALNVARMSHSATTQLDGKILIAGGNNGAADLNSLETFDPSVGTFTLSTSSLATARSGHLAFLLPHSAAILIIGGTSSGVAQPSSELYYPWTGAFNPNFTAPMVAARAQAIGGPLGDGTPTSQNDGVFVVAGGVDATGAPLSSTELYGFAFVKTDQTEYAPGQTVNITGSGWVAGETVTLNLVESPNVETIPPLTAVADANGNISNSQYSPNQHDINVAYALTAAGSVSKAQTTFADDPAPTVAVALMPSTVVVNNPTTAKVTVVGQGACAPTNDKITWSSNGSGNFSSTTCTLSSLSCSVTFTPTNVATDPQTITASFPVNGGEKCAAQTGTASLTVDQAPAITSANNTTFTVGTAGSFSVTATGFPASTFSVTVGTLPSGVTLTSTGLLSGTPTAGTGGTYPITITANNGVSPNATQNFTLTVDQAPAITSAASTTFTVGTLGSFTVAATGFPTAMTFSETGNLPSGVTLTSAGVLSGTPAAGTGGTYPIMITASNGVSPSGTQNFTLTVDQAPAITSTSSATFTVGTAGSFTVTASGFPAPAFSEMGSLPSGVTLTSAGLLSGTPAAGTSGTYTITIVAANGVGANATQSFTLTVNQKPAITSANNTTFTVGAAGIFTVTATGSPAPTLSESGALPSGVTFTPSTGVVSGTPAANTGGTYSITFTAANGVSPNATQTFTLTVDQAPAITSGASTTFTVGTAGSFALTTSGFPTTMTFSETGTLPGGLTLSPTGALSGTPAAGTGGTYLIVITASNGVSPNATQNFTLTVNQAPAITSANSTTFVVNTTGSFTFTATGFPAPTFTESGSLPTGVTLSSSGVLSGTAATTGNFPITVTASNGVSPASTQSFTLTIGQAPSFISSNNTSFTVNSPGSFTVTATGFPTPTFTEGGALPSGVTLTSAGVLSGTPALGTVGSYPITITASNGVGTNATQAFTLTVSKITSSFSGLTASQTIPYGQGSISLSGKVNGYTMMTGTVTITVNGVSLPGIALNGNPNNFGPVTFNTSTIPASATPYVITYAYSGDANSTPTNDTSTALTVNPVDPTLTWANPAAIPYGTALSATQLNATFTAPFNGGTVTVPGTATYTPAAGTVLNVGTNQNLSVSFVPTDTTDYRSASKTVQINVNPVATTTSISAPTVSFNNNGVVTVTVASTAGTPTGTVSLTVDSGTPLNQTLNGSGVATFTLTSPTAGAHSLSASYSAQGNFGGSSATSSLQVNYPAPTLTMVNPSSGNLNTTLNVMLTGSGFFTSVTTVSFGADITVNSVTINTQNQITANITIPPTANVGVHNVSVTDLAPGGGTATLSGAFTVNNPATSTQVISSENPSIYGDLVTFTATVSSVSGTPTGSLTFYDGSCGGTLLAGPTSLVNSQAAFQTSALNAGAHSIFACYTPTGTYLPSSGSISQQVNQAQATLSFGSLTFGYDGNPKPITVATSPLNLTGVSILYNGSPTPPTDAGSTPVSATLTNANYTATPINGTEVIQPAPVMITVTDPNVTYDGNSHGAVIGVSPNVAVMVTYNGSPTAPTSAGIYSVMVTVTQPNYTGTRSGTLTINKATPTINWANPADITYGTALSGTQLNATATFGLGGPTVVGAFTYNPVSGTVLPAGDGQMLSADFAPTDSTDFNSVLGTTVLINVKTDPLYVISSDGSRSYGAANPTFTPTFIGFVNGDSASTIGNPTCTSGVTSAALPGTYAIVCAGVTSSNYTVRYINGTLTVTNPLTAITAVTDTQGGTIQIGQTDTLTATGAFADGNKRTLASAGGLSFSRGDLTTPVSGAAIAEAGGVLYAIGGFDGSNTLGAIQAYSPKTNTWATISVVLATPRTKAAVASTAGKIYVIGGNDAGGNPLTSIEVLDTTVATPAVSTFVSSLTTARANSAAVVWNQKLYVIAGMDASNNPLSSVEIFDLVTGNVSSGDTGTPLAQASAAALSSNSTSTLYVVGSTGSNVVALSTTDGATWTSPTSTSLVGTNGVGTVAFNNLLYVVNGANVWSYDGTNFVQKNSVGNPHNGSQPVAIGSRIYVTSNGFGAPGAKLDAFAPDEVTWASADTTKATIDNSGDVQGVAITSPTVTLLATSISNQNITGSFALTVIKKSQTIQFGALTNATYGDPDIVISATSVDANTNPTNLLVSFAASPANVCTLGTSVLSGSASIATLHITGAGSCTITASQPGDAATWAPAPDVPQSFSIAKATPTVAVSFATSPITYDGNPHPATAVVTGVNSTVLSADGAVTISYTPGGSSAPVNAGTYSASASFSSSNPNYNDVNSTVSASLTINKATAMVVVTPYTVTYDGSAHTATVTSITGVNGEMGVAVGTVTLNTTHTNAGTYATDSWSFTGAANYNNIASTTITDTINKATATVVVTPYTVIYDGSAHTATVTSITGVNGEMGVTVGTVTLNTTHTNAGTYATDSWSFTGAANYNDIASTTITDTINKATATVVVTPYTVTYDGNAHTATVTSITGVNGEVGATVGTVDVSKTTHTAAGIYSTDSWCFTGAANYNNIANTAITDIINKATGTVVVTPYTVTYDGSAHTATVSSIIGVNGEVGATVGTVTLNTTHTNAGTYATDSWSFTGAANYNDIASTAIIDTINKALASVTPNTASKVYGTSDPLLTGALSGFVPSDNVTATYTRTAGQTVVGSPYTISAALSPASVLGNYNISYNTANFNITAAPLTITASSGSMIYGGPVFPVTPTYTAGPPTGFVNGDSSASLTTQPACGTTATSTSPVGGNPYSSSCVGAMDSNYTISYSPGWVTVQQATTTTAVASSSPNNTSTFMQLVTFTATVTPQYAGTVPTGTVVFYNNGSQIGTEAVSVASCGTPPCPDQATFSTSSLPDSGPDSITAVYGGDGDFISSTSPAITQTVQPAPNVSLNPLSVSFGNQNVNTTSKPAPVVLTNIGDANLNISANGISIMPSTDFAQTNNCGSSVAAGKSCTINITFTPIDTGIRTASLQITDNDDDSANAQQIVSLTGSGLSTIMGGSLYTDAIVATANGCGSIVMSGGSSVDSFNSTQGYSLSHQLAGGNVATNGNVTLNGSKSAIYGTAAVESTTTGNCSKTAVTGVTTNGGAQVTGGVVPLVGGVNYPIPPAPNPAPPTTTQNVSGSCGSLSGCTNMGNKTVVLAPGQYGNLSISGGTTAHVSAGTYNINSLTLSGQSILYVDSGPVIVNLAGNSLSGANPAMDASGGSIQNPSGIPANLQFTYSGSRGINLTGGSASYATVDTPNALVNMTGGSDFFGSIVASTVTNSGGTTIHYDTNLPAISKGNYIWFNAVVNNVTGLPSSGQVKLYLTNSSISFTADGTPYTMAVPNAVVTFNSSTGLGTTYSTSSSRWNTSVPKSSLTGNTFVAGVAFPVPINLSTGIQNVAWSTSFSTDTPGITLQWQWSAAVYGSFSTTYATSTNPNVLGLNPEDGSADPNGSDAAGSPETYKSSLTFGATGGGGTNYTGYFTSGAGVVPTVAPLSVSPSSLGFAGQTQGSTSAAMTTVLTNNDSAWHTISSIVTTGSDAGDFGVTHNCPLYPNSLTTGTSCTITVTFTPGDVGTRTAKIVVNDDANNTPQTVYLSGTGQ